MTDEQLYTSVSVEKNDRSEITITAEIPIATAERHHSAALKKLGAEIELPGFRKGRAPEKLLLERVGEQALLEEIAERAVAEAYPRIIAEHNLSVIGRPHVSITKLAKGNPIAFKIETALEPNITLPDYRALASEVMREPDELEVTDKDVENVLLNIRKNKWRIDNKEQADKGEEPKDEELPELTDELVKQLGDFDDVTDFTNKLRENLKVDKARKAREKKRVALGERIISEATIPLPRILIESELNGMLGQFKSDIARMGMDFETYLGRIQKTEDDLRKEWEGDAAKRAKLQLVLNDIARQEQITPDEQDVEREIEHLKTHVKDADPERLRLYVTSVLRNEAVFRSLEKEAEKPLSPS